MKQKTISIIIPAHNEERRIGRTLEEYSEFFENLKKKNEIKDFEMLIVINNTKDNTEDIVKDYKKRYHEIKYLNYKQGGKGFAIIEGFKDALKRKNNIIGFVDADMATPPEAYYWLIQEINGNDGTIASRALEGSVASFTFKRKLTHKGFNMVVRNLLCLPYSDTQCGAKVFKKEAIEAVVNELGMTQWCFDVDLLYRLRKKGFKIKEIKTIWEDKTGSKLDLRKVPLRMFASVIRLRLLNSRFCGLVKVYDKLPEWIKIHH